MRRFRLALAMAVVAVASVPGVDATAAVDAADALCFDVTGLPGDIVLVNLTPVGASAAGHGQLSSDAALPPTASNVNFAPGTVDPNVATARIGADGRVCFHNSVHATVDLVADPVAVFSAESTVAAVGARRVVDTRLGLGGPTLARSGRLCFAVDGSPGDIVLVNLTPVGASAAGHGQLTSSDVAEPPTASNVNFAPGTVDPNVATAPIGADGDVCFHNSVHASVDLVADQLLTIGAGAIDPAAPVAPLRVLDTRTGLGGTRVAAGHRLCFAVPGTPAGADIGARGDLVIVNLTPVGAETSGSGQLLSSSLTTPPIRSDVNFGPGTVDPNLATAEIGPDGRVCFVNSVHGAVDVIADVLTVIDADDASSMPLAPRVDTRDIGTITAQLCIDPVRCLATFVAPASSSSVSSWLGFLRSTDGGRTWLHASPIDLMQSFLDVRLDRIVCPTAGGCLATGRTRDISPNSGKLEFAYVSTDVGRSWAVAPFGGANDIECVEPGVCLVVGYFEVPFNTGGLAAVTIDHAATWRDIVLPANTPPLRAIDCVSPTTCIAQTEQTGSLMFTTPDDWRTVVVG